MKDDVCVSDRRELDKRNRNQIGGKKEKKEKIQIVNLGESLEKEKPASKEKESVKEDLFWSELGEKEKWTDVTGTIV